MSNKYKLNFVFHRFQHHSLYSGYDRLLQHIDGFAWNHGSAKGWQRVPYRLSQWAVDHAHIGAYNRARCINELSVMCNLLGFKQEIFHYLYGEDGYCFSGYECSSANERKI